MRPANDRLFELILGLGPTAKYNLTSSGLSEPDLSAMGVDTSFEKFAAEKGDHARLFAEEIAKLYKIEPDNVVATNGASEAMFLVYSALGEGRRAVVPLPNYGPMFNVPKALGMNVASSLMSSSAAGRAIFGLTDPNNPTGRSLDDGTVDSLLESRAEEDFVFINETYKEFTFPEKPNTLFGRASNVVTCSTMTKFYGLGRLRVGWILADKGLARKLLYAKWAVSGHNSEYSLWIATQVLRMRERFVRRAGEILSRNLGLVNKFIEETKVISTELGAPPFCLVHYRSRPGSVRFAKELLEKTGVLVAPGDYFGAPKAFRLCFTSDEKTLRVGLNELSNYLNGSFKER